MIRKEKLITSECLLKLLDLVLVISNELLQSAVMLVKLTAHVQKVTIGLGQVCKELLFGLAD